MTAEVVAQIEAQVVELRARGGVPDGLEDELEACFEQAAEAVLTSGSESSGDGGRDASIDMRSALGLAGLKKKAAMLVRRRLGPPFRRLERKSVLGAARAAETAWLQVHVGVDHLERVAARSVPVSRVLSVLRPRELAGAAAEPPQPAIGGPLLTWVLDRLSASERVPGPVLHAESGDGSIVEALAARGVDARGADPRLSVRAGGDTSTVAAGALEYLGAAPSGALSGLLLTGVVDRLRPGAARALARLAARSLAPGGVVVLVGARPEVVVAIDPVAADLAPGRPIHPVTWCHLLAHFGLSELTIFEADASEPDMFAVSARRPLFDRADTDGGGR